MASRGKHETELLRMNIEDQLNRLLTQLEDLDELKDGKEEEEVGWELFLTCAVECCCRGDDIFSSFSPISATHFLTSLFALFLPIC